MIVEKLWKLREQKVPKAVIKRIKSYGFSEEMAKILAMRNLLDEQSIRKFLDCTEEHFHDPFLLPDIQKLLDRVRQARELDEFVAIYGDYDADGTVSASILTRTLKKIGLKKVLAITPHRNSGYGLKEHIIKGLKQRKDVKLIIACDCGSSNKKEIDYANKLGIDVIVVDHHDTIQKIKPFAFVNPKRKDSKYPFRDLCGAGIVFKIVQALEKIGEPIVANRCIDYIAIATVADVSPLIDENRIIVKYGMQKLRTTKNIPLKAMLETLSLYGREITAEMIGFIIGPRLNAPGRIRSANITMKFLMCDDYKKAVSLFKQMNQINEKRKEIEREIKNDAMEMLERMLNDKVIVLASDKWHKGIIGIVASVVKEYYTRPVILFSLENGVGYGSARNIEEFPLLKALEQCKDLLKGYGGHTMAAGLSIAEENLKAFRLRINEIADRELDENSLIPSAKAVFELDEKKVNLEFIRELKRLEPFGNHNEVPHFVMRDIIVSDRNIRDSHLMLKISKGKKTFNSPGFWMAEYQELLKDDIQEFDVLFELNENFYKGHYFVQLLLKDLKEVRLDW